VAHLRHLLLRAEHGAEALSPPAMMAGTGTVIMLMVTMLPAAALATLTARPGPVGADVVFALYDTPRPWLCSPNGRAAMRPRHIAAEPRHGPNGRGVR
jgi:hypothetical protein